MNDQDMDRLLERAFCGDPAGQVFRARVLLDSTAALRRARRSRARWRFAALSAAAVFLASVSFLLGRCSVPSNLPQPADTSAVANAGDTVAVPGELVEWLQAARFFGQLGMKDRVALAYDRASKLVPCESAAFADAESPDWQESPSPHRAAVTKLPPAESTKLIIAQSFGD